VSIRNRLQLKLGALLVLATLAACSSPPAPPAWQANAQQSLNRSIAAYLAGSSRVADFEFSRARAEVAKTGRPDRMARIELVRCAAKVACLEFDECPGYAALALDAAPAERAYAAFLVGRSANPELLPAHQRRVLEATDTEGTVAALAAIEDPFARLVAAGVLVRTGRSTPRTLRLATDTASTNGWSRPLLAWLGVTLQRAEAAGDTASAAQLRRRIDLVAPRAAANP
jgi:hypothetical protein